SPTPRSNPLSLHDALPILAGDFRGTQRQPRALASLPRRLMETWLAAAGKHLIVAFFVITGVSNLTKARIADHVERMHAYGVSHRSEEHTSELQSLRHLVCR